MAISANKKTKQVEDPSAPKSKGLKTLNYYQKRAIDFSRRNRLLKFPKTAPSVEFEVPLDECEETFSSISEFYLELPHKEVLEQDKSEKEKEDEEESEFVLPETNVKGKKLITLIDKLRLQAKNNFDSHGLHTLFLAVGEIQWKEQLAGRGSSTAVKEADYAAPLLLIPIQITNQKSPQKMSVITVNTEQYDIQINPVLNLFIQQELELTLPKNLPESFEETKWEEIQKILDKYIKLLKEEKGIECVSSTRIRLGQYTFHGQQIYEDLIRNEENIYGNEFVSSLCGSGQLSQVNDKSDLEDDEEEIDSFLSAEEDYTILDADESQIRAIQAAVKGKHLVIHGPPGTGKSQTIANLIASLLARGKKVLFVCEKQVALDVVYNRLQTKGADITDLCLPLFHHSSDKKNFAKSIIESRNRILKEVESNRKDSINRKLADRTARMESLKAYFESLTVIIEPLEKSIYWIHGELARVAPKAESTVLPWKSKEVGDLNHSQYQKILFILSELSTYKDIIFDNSNHWKNLKQQTFSPDFSARLFAKLKELATLVSKFPELKENVFGNPATINEIQGLLEISKTLDLDNLTEERLIKAEKFNSKNLSLELKKINSILSLVQEYEKTAGKERYKVPTEWKVLKLKRNWLSDSLGLDVLREAKVGISLLQETVPALESLVKKNKYSNVLSGTPISKLKEYGGILAVDPLIQRIKGWDERVSLYKVKEDLAGIKTIYDRLNTTKATLNEWSISPQELPKALLLEIEERFATKYNSFFRVFYSSYKKDKVEVMRWCVTKRPQTFNQYKEIVSASSDALRLENKFSKLLDEFVEKHGEDDSLKSISVRVLVDGVNKLITYLEKMNLDRVAADLKTLFIDIDALDSFREIISKFDGISSEANSLNTLTAQQNLTDQILLSDFLKFATKIAAEAKQALSAMEVVGEYITPNERPKTIIEAEAHIITLNKLSEICDKIITEEYEIYTNLSSLEELLSEKRVVEAQREQLSGLLKIIGDHSLSRDDFYEQLSTFTANIGTWNTCKTNGFRSRRKLVT